MQMRMSCVQGFTQDFESSRGIAEETGTMRQWQHYLSSAAYNTNENLRFPLLVELGVRKDGGHNTCAVKGRVGEVGADYAAIQYMYVCMRIHAYVYTDTP
jgi:hypothetical protein